MNDNKTREEELATATAHYMRTAGDLFRAQERNQTHGDYEGFDAAVAADDAAHDRLMRVLDQFPKDDAQRLWMDILAARKAL